MKGLDKGHICVYNVTIMKPRVDKPALQFPLDRVVSNAPPGALGGFLQHKLREYVEPSRAGTPKGEPVGLSKQKYHAALLRGLSFR